jgi:hypothetical protein
MAASLAKCRPALLLLLLAALPGMTGCELIVRFDRDRVQDSGVRLDGQVVGDATQS